jgi:hypothetical protein
MRHISRRNMLRAALLGTGYVGLRSLASGIPIPWLRGQIPEALAAEPTNPQFMILSTNSAGDPFNANCPGAYGVPGVYNNPDPAMAPRSMTFGSTQTQAAAPWDTLPGWVKQQTTFIHHRTYQNAHPQYAKVMTLLGNVKGASGNGTDHLSALMSSQLAGALGTIQSEQVSLGGGRISFNGRSIQSLKPTLLRQMLAPRQGTSLNLQQLRDQTLDEMHQYLRMSGRPEQREWLDRHALSRNQARQIDDALLARLASLEDNGPISQIRAAVTLILMKVSPVITLHVPFGGDNHADRTLEQERDETIAGIAAFNVLFQELQDAGLQDDVTVANFSVFGRTLRRQENKGRDHNLNHHVMMISGPAVQGGVIGGIQSVGKDYGCTDINSATGEGVEGADIKANESLESTAKTLGRALGVSGEVLEQRIDGGKIIQAALKP